MLVIERLTAAELQLRSPPSSDAFAAWRRMRFMICAGLRSQQRTQQVFKPSIHDICENVQLWTLAPGISEKICQRCCLLLFRSILHRWPKISVRQDFPRPESAD